MNKQITQRLNDSATMRWGALGVVAFTMMAAYFVNDVMAPMKGLLESGMGWSSSDYGYYTGGYSFLNVFLLMLIWGGFILDKFGVRFTGKLSTILMVAGTALQYYGLTVLVDNPTMIFGYSLSVNVAFIGYAIFGVGAEVAGITVTKVIAKWFKGKEMATAMGVQVALARIGSQAAYALALPIASRLGITTPVLIGILLLLGGMVAFFVFSVWDKKLDKQISDEPSSGDEEEKFSFKDVVSVVKNPGFWLIAVLCVLFYSCVFPFQKFATELMILKYGVNADWAGFIAGSPALGALILTPIFGSYIDKRGKAASIMTLGAAMLIVVHAVYAIPSIHSAWVAVLLMLILGVAFSLVPSAMWPSVAKIFPSHQLGTAYALIFFIQNIGLWGIPTLIGSVLAKYCIVGSEEVVNEVTGAVESTNIYDYTLPMIIFTCIALLSLFVALALKAIDKKNGYNLEKANIEK
ncbi:MAG: MFS transporter [Rikenellaceae bacterium]